MKCENPNCPNDSRVPMWCFECDKLGVDMIRSIGINKERKRIIAIIDKMIGFNGGSPFINRDVFEQIILNISDGGE